MNGRVIKLDLPTHQAVQALLPWYASSQLPADEAHLVEQHLHACDQCRQDLQWERDLHAEAQADIALDTPPDGVDVERAWARMMPALGAQDGAGDEQALRTPGPAQAQDGVSHATAPDDIGSATSRDDKAFEPTTTAVDGATAQPPLVTQRWWRKDAANQSSWLRWTMVAQWALIIGLVAMLARPDEPAPAYRVLGNGVSNTGNLVVMFNPNTTERDLRRILQAQGARVVDGPTVTDAYLLNVPAEHRESALQALRGDPAVKLAEALDDGAAP